MEKSVSFYPKMRFAAGLAVAVFCLLTSSCDLPPAWGDGKGSLTIALPGASGPDRAAAESRAVHLPEELTNNMSYSLKLTSDSGSFESFSDIRDKVVTVNLAPGHWFISAMASYGTTPAGVSEAETDIQAGRENFVSLTMAADEFITPRQTTWDNNDIYIGTGNSTPAPFSIGISASTEFASITGWTDDFSYQRYYKNAGGTRTNLDSTPISFSNPQSLTLPVSNVNEGTFSYYVEVINEYTYTSDGKTTNGKAVRSIHVGDVMVVSGTTKGIGETGPGGGTIFYVGLDFTVNGKVCHYLEVGPVLGQPQWGSYGAFTGAGGITIGTGWTNTQTIINALSNSGETGRAAQVARAHKGGGLSDWFLPSMGELQELYKSEEFGTYSPIWTSTESGGDARMACRIRNSDGNLEVSSKTSTATYVRPIRAF